MCSAGAASSPSPPECDYNSRGPSPHDVFSSGEAGYNCFRIPALLRLPDGAVALYAEARKHSCDDHGRVDLVYKRSVDGITWGPLSLLYSASGSSQNVTIGNPSPVVVDGRVLMVFCRDNMRVLTLRSLDSAGLRWPAVPTDVTAQLALGGGAIGWVATGPPGALRLPSGRVLVPLNFKRGARRCPGQEPAATSMWRAMRSDDGGVTWATSESEIEGGNEGQIALAPNGSLIANMRVHVVPPTADAERFDDTLRAPALEGRRFLSWSHDGGVSWTTPLSDVLAPLGGDCEGSMVRRPRAERLTRAGAEAHRCRCCRCASPVATCCCTRRHGRTTGRRAGARGATSCCWAPPTRAPRGAPSRRRSRAQSHGRAGLRTVTHGDSHTVTRSHMASAHRAASRRTCRWARSRLRRTQRSYRSTAGARRSCTSEVCSTKCRTRVLRESLSGCTG